MSKEYDAIVADVAQRLEVALRKSQPGQHIYVVAWPTNETENGRVEVRVDNNPIGLGGQIVAPLNSHTGSWNHVPYSHLYTRLWHSLRSEPIMPIHPVAAQVPGGSVAVRGAGQVAV